LAGFGFGGGEVSCGEGGLVGGFCFETSFASFVDGACFEEVGCAVEDVDGFDAGFDEVAGAEEEAGEMTGDVAVGVFEWCTVLLADDGEELVDDVVGVDGDDASAEVSVAAGGLGEEFSEVDAHIGVRRGMVVVCFMSLYMWVAQVLKKSGWLGVFDEARSCVHA